jgi:site-specific recombinase XerD
MNKDTAEVYGYHQKLKRILERIGESSLSEQDKTTLVKYHEDLLLDGLGIGRVIKYLNLLLLFSRKIDKNFEKVTEEDMKHAVSTIEKDQHYSEWSKYDFKIAVRKFYKWLRKTENYPKEVAWMKIFMKNGNTKLPEQMLSEEDVKKLIDMARGSMERALIAVLYESGCRIGEILTMRIRCITFDKYGAQIVVNGKTEPRRVRIISSVPYLQEWLNAHPFKDDVNSWVWLNKRRGCLKYTSVTDILRELKRISGVKKPLNAHNFRHSRATFLASHFTERQLRMFFGWRDNRMADVYVHMAGRDVDTALLKLYGITPKEDDTTTVLTPKKCIRCEEVNPATNKFCSKCGMIIDEKTMIDVVEKDIERKEADNILDKLIEDDEFRRMLEEKIKLLSFGK